MPLSEESFGKQHVDTRQSRGIQGAKIQLNFGQRNAKELYHIRLAKFETAITHGGLVPGGFEGNRGRQAPCHVHGQATHSTVESGILERAGSGLGIHSCANPSLAAFATRSAAR